MKDRTLRYALHVLDSEVKYGTHEQYYEGAKRMLEIIISEMYENDSYIEVDETGKHYIIK